MYCTFNADMSTTYCSIMLRQMKFRSFHTELLSIRSTSHRVAIINIICCSLFLYAPRRNQYLGCLARTASTLTQSFSCSLLTMVRAALLCSRRLFHQLVSTAHKCRWGGNRLTSFQSDIALGKLLIFISYWGDAGHDFMPWPAFISRSATKNGHRHLR